MALSQSDIYSLAKAAGLTDSRAKVAAAVAMAESGGNPNAHNSKPPDDSYGLWQINMLGGLGPARRKSLGLSANSDLYNPQTNAKAMKQISSNGGNFSPWSTYTNGSYLKFMNKEVKDDSNDPGFWDKVGGAITGAIPGYNAVKDTGEAAITAVGYLGKTATWLSDSDNWVRIAYVAGGAVVVLAGLNALLQSTSVGKAATATVTKGATLVATKGMAK
jgi:hypothetical protein